VANFRWLSDAHSSSIMMASSKIPEAKLLMKDEQLYELTRGIPGIARFNYITAENVHVMLFVKSDRDGEQTFDFWTETGTRTLIDDWMRNHPQPEETLHVTSAAWELRAGNTVLARGTIDSAPKSCSQKSVTVTLANK
jgi:hypothetical protein